MLQEWPLRHYLKSKFKNLNYWDWLSKWCKMHWEQNSFLPPKSTFLRSWQPLVRDRKNLKFLHCVLLISNIAFSLKSCDGLGRYVMWFIWILWKSVIRPWIYRRIIKGPWISHIRAYYIKCSKVYTVSPTVWLSFTY